MRDASIDKALRRGFKGPFHRVREREMQRLIWDIKYARRARAVVAEVPA